MAGKKGRGDNATGPAGYGRERAAGDNDSLKHALSLAATLANLRGEYEKANAYLEEVFRWRRRPRKPNPRKRCRWEAG